VHPLVKQKDFDNISVFITTQELTTDQLHQKQFRVATTDQNLS